METLRMRALFAACDAGSANVVLPILDALSRRGHRVASFTQGRATELFASRDVEHVSVPDVRATADNFHFLQTRFRDVQPDCVVTGLSWPSRFEQMVHQIAKMSGVPIVVVEDVSGAASVRVQEPVAQVFATDTLSLALARERHPKAGGLIVGNVGAFVPTVKAEIAAQFEAIRRLHPDALFFIFTESGKPNDVAVEEQIKLLGACVRMTQGNVRIIPRLHHKWREESFVPDVSLHAYLMSQLENELGDRLVRFDDGAIDNLVPFVDGVISVFSTVLTTAAYSGKVAVSLSTQASTDFMVEATGLSYLPLARLGLAHSIEVPTDLWCLRAAQSLKALEPFNAMLACARLEELYGRAR